MNLQIAHEGNIAVVTLNRPERRNALSLELMLDLIAALDEIGRNRRDPRGDSGRRRQGLLLRPRSRRR